MSDICGNRTTRRRTHDTFVSEPASPSYDECDTLAPHAFDVCGVRTVLHEDIPEPEPTITGATHLYPSDGSYDTPDTPAEYQMLFQERRRLKRRFILLQYLYFVLSFFYIFTSLYYFLLLQIKPT